MTALDSMGMYDNEEMYELEDRYDELMDQLPIEYQNGLLDLDLDGLMDPMDALAATGQSGARGNDEDDEDDSDTDEDDAKAGGSRALAAIGKEQKSGKKKKKKKKSPIPAFNPIIGDGRFLFAIVPVKPSKFEEKKKDEEKSGKSGQNGDEKTSESKDDSKTADNNNDVTTSLSGRAALMASNAIGSLVRDRSESHESVDYDFGGDIGQLTRRGSTGAGDGKKKKKKKKKDKEDKITFVHLSVNAFDPESENKMEHCHSIQLKRPTPGDNDSILDFNPTGMNFCFFICKGSNE